VKRLAGLAGSLRFVDRCYTRIVRRDDGAEAGDALKARLKYLSPCQVWSRIMVHIKAFSLIADAWTSHVCTW
jgi:hypothetical protein